MTRRDLAEERLDPLALATELHAALDTTSDLQSLLPLLAPLLEALRAREGLLPWLVVQDPLSQAGARRDFEAGFAAFWVIYPVKVGKVRAKQAAYRAAKRGDWPGWERVLAAVRAQKETPRWRGGTIPNPETWFNGGRWEDDPATMSAIGGNGWKRAEDAPPPGYLMTESEVRSWPRLNRWERQNVLNTAGMEQDRRRSRQEAGREEYVKT